MWETIILTEKKNLLIEISINEIMSLLALLRVFVKKKKFTPFVANIGSRKAMFYG
jgi:hypothetical protein